MIDVARKATKQQTKEHNTQLVLKTIYQNDNMSRADISRATLLARPTVSTIVADLMTRQFVVETGIGTSFGGKPPTILDIDYNAYHILCLDLDGDCFRGALVNLKAEIHKQIHLPSPHPNGGCSLEGVYELIDDLLAISRAPIVGIAIGSGGLIDPYKGFVHNAVHLGWQKMPLKQLLEERYDQPVYLTNNSQAAALAEYSFNVRPGVENLIVIKASQGLGAGVIINGRPFYGSGFGAGEIGHVVVNNDGKQCSCSNIGCLETIATPAAIIEDARQLAIEQPDSWLAQSAITWDAICVAYRQNDPLVTGLIEKAGGYLGAAVANLIAFLSINHIVIIGDIIELGEKFLTYIKQEATRNTLADTAANTAITYSNLGEDSVILGSAALVLKYELGIV